VPNERSSFERPSVETMRRVVAMARVALPEEVSVQVPPNLSPTTRLLDCGVDDLGGVSPVTDDYINPDYQWPALRELEDLASGANVPLHERLPVYERYLSAPASADVADPLAESDDRTDRDDRAWVSERIRAAIAADDDAGRRYRACLSSVPGNLA
jgi:FO synthase subunit 1